LSVTKNCEAPHYAFFPAFCYCLPFEVKSLPQHPVLRNHQSIYLLEQQTQESANHDHAFLCGLSFPLRLLCYLDTGKRIALFNCPSTTPFQDGFFFLLSECLGLNENTSTSFALPFRPPFPTARPSQTKLHGIYFIFRCDLNSIYSSLPLSATVAPSLNISRLCTFIFYSIPTESIKK